MHRETRWTRTTVRLARDGLLGIDDGRDVVLREGDSFVIERPGRTVVQALDPAELALDAANDSRYSTASRPLITKGAA